VIVYSNAADSTVTATVHYETRDSLKQTTTNGRGKASLGFVIDEGVSPGYVVVIDISVGKESCSTAFTPI
jgi:hypothetical protein